ncbi:hypothetical protein AVEN_119018-1 [Araneus ventricosus]|uniref:Uncharacterized protein n=1 Tax=Araneus ventricosus TaxID=182803 RepID=A0A4Y2KPP6_ARAVE|nr:hypothetical protein AVEN_119018-1 [Araneus ventricosus]
MQCGNGLAVHSGSIKPLGLVYVKSDVKKPTGVVWKFGEETIEELVNLENEVLNQKESVQDNSSVDYPQPKRFLPNPCAACLGILQGTCDEMVTKVAFFFLINNLLPKLAAFYDQLVCQEYDFH